MAVMPEPAAQLGPQTIDLREPAGWRRTKNRIMTVLMWVAFVLVLIPLGFVLYTVIEKGAGAISWQFLTSSTIPPNVLPLGTGGMGPAVIGTLEITGFAALIAVPLGVLGAVYISEYGGRNWLAKIISFMADVIHIFFMFDHAETQPMEPTNCGTLTDRFMSRGSDGNGSRGIWTMRGVRVQFREDFIVVVQLSTDS